MFPADVDVNRAALGHRIARVDHQDEDHLLQVVRIDHDGAGPALDVDRQANLFV